SLAHFQLGESGDGATLLAHARRSGPPQLSATLALFIGEEQEHARLLARLVERFGGRLTTRHWTHFLFQRVRHRGGLEFEITVLVVAELVGNAYYRLLERHTMCPVLRETC